MKRSIDLTFASTAEPSQFNKAIKEIPNPYLAFQNDESFKRHHRPLHFLAQGDLSKKAQFERKRLNRQEYQASKKNEEKLLKAAAIVSPSITESATPSNNNEVIIATATNNLLSSKLAFVSCSNGSWTTPSFERWDLPYLPKPLRDRPANEHPRDAPYTELTTVGNKKLIYVEHPVPILPTDASTESTAPLPVYQTKKEMKRIRRKLRAARTQEKRDMIAVGLLPAPPPKVKLSNLMRVLTTEATLDPSQIEARVKQEVAQREAQHLARNMLKKLTPEEKLAKHRRKMEADVAKGSHMAVFLVYNILTGDEEIATKRRSKMLATASDLSLTGRLIVVTEVNQPSIVLVEGGPRGILRFCRVMLRSIKWSAQTLLEAKGIVKNKEDDEEDEERMEEVENDEDTKKKNADSKASCYLMWRGQIARREFDKFKLEMVEASQDAQRILLSRNCVHIWDACLRFDPEVQIMAVDDL